MKLVGLLIAVAAFGTARIARELTRAEGERTTFDEPYAPSPAAAPFVSLGYREAAADLLFVRMIGYFGGDDSTADGIAALAEATLALDPDYHRIYGFGARAMTIANRGVTQASYLRAIAVLEHGIARFPEDWKLPYLAGQIYTQDLQTEDPAQRARWDDRGTSLIEAAVRKPNAPLGIATWAASMRSRLGQQQRAIDGLTELILLTSDPAIQERLMKKLSELQNEAGEVAAAKLEEQKRFTEEWQTARPAIPLTLYILVGPRPPAAFDMTDLATGGRDLVVSQPIERLEAITDDPPTRTGPK